METRLPPPPFDQVEEVDRLDLQLVHDFVTSCHGDLERVEELLQVNSAVLNAARDWGGGDWETGLGGAAHMGRRDIALRLLDAGARLDIFAAAMLGYLEIVRSAVSARPDILDVLGPHGIPLIAHAKAGGDQAAEVLALIQRTRTKEP